jgi:hypothetical protein
MVQMGLRSDGQCQQMIGLDELFIGQHLDDMRDAVT